MRGLYKALLLTGVVGVLSTQAGVSAAAESMMLRGVDLTGVPGTVVAPVFTLDIGQPVEIINLNINWDYDPAYLEFRKDLTTVTFQGQERGLSGFIDLVKSMFGANPQVFSTEDATTAWGSKHYDYTIFPAGFESALFSGQLTIKTAFNLKGNVLVGQSTEIVLASNFVDVDENEFPLFATATVQAVPEPQSWLLLLAGLGVIAWTTQRRRA